MAEQERNGQPREDQDTERYSSTETRDGREGFTGGEDLSGREDFAGRPNVTEERQLHALDPEDDERQARDPAR
jgi:hypothetical protein